MAPDLRRAIAHGQKAVVEYPGSPEYHWLFALALYRAGRLDEALEVLRQPGASRDGDPQSFLLRAMTLARLGRLADARTALSQAVAMNSSKQRTGTDDANRWTEQLEIRLLREEAEALLRPAARNE